MSSNQPPTRPDIPEEFAPIHARVRQAISSLPLYFRSETTIEGIAATDIFTLNSALGATIENQVVATLNQLRSIWDPDGSLREYGFVRQSQTFPDVLLKRLHESEATTASCLLGIELKGWYLLAKEGVPSFRFTVTPAACACQDLIVVVPWALTNVISGRPLVFAPYIESARYAAEFRNHWWAHVRQTSASRAIQLAQGVAPYPRKSDRIVDVPESDSGNNFGRFARTGIMDDYLALAKQELLAGIRAEHWLGFFQLFQDQKQREQLTREIAALRDRIEPKAGSQAPTSAAAALTIIESLERLLDLER